MFFKDNNTFLIVFVRIMTLNFYLTGKCQNSLRIIAVVLLILNLLLTTRIVRECSCKDSMVLEWYKNGFCEDNDFKSLLDCRKVFEVRIIFVGLLTFNLLLSARIVSVRIV